MKSIRDPLKISHEPPKNFSDPIGRFKMASPGKKKPMFPLKENDISETELFGKTYGRQYSLKQYV